MHRLLLQPANMYKRILKGEEDIQAPASKVWSILTSLKYTQQFFFDERLVSDWKKGDPIYSETEIESVKQIMKKGWVEQVHTGESLEFTLLQLDRFSFEPVLCLFQLLAMGETVRLVFSMEICLYAPDVYPTLSAQCKMMLQKIKWLAEFS